MTSSDASVTAWQPPNLLSRKASPVVNSVAQQKPKNAHSREAHDQELQRQIKQGFEKGYRDGLEAGEKQLNEHLAAINQILANLSAPLAKVDHQIANELIQLSARLAETIIHQQIELQPELVEKQVAQALATLSARPTSIIIRLHPEDAKIIEKYRAEHKAIAASDVDLDGLEYRITPDAALHRGGCVLKTPTTTVDATIEKQLRDSLEDMLSSAAQE